ncbi:MAG: hypothetical protein E7549_03560 [Ruminococcaceae bacterium]|nr:hypothetical protein [Oscillospiraceae bacterium]
MKRILSLALSLALLLSCVSGITLFTAAEELPAPFGYFNFGGTNGKTQNDIGVVRYILAKNNETDTLIRNGTAIGDTGLYGFKVANDGYGLYFGGTLLNNVPENTGVSYAVEYYIDSETALTGEVLLVSDSRNGDEYFSDLAVGQQGVVFYTLTPEEVDAIRGNDTRLRIKMLGEGVNKLYITGVKILDAQYVGGIEAVPYSYYDFEQTVSAGCPYYPELEGAPIADVYQMSYADMEIDTPPGFAGYRYFKLTADAPAYAEENVNKPVYLRFFTKDGYENTSISIDTYQIYGEKKADGQMASTHSSLINGAASILANVVEGVGGAIIPAACLRNGAGHGSFRLQMAEAEKIARVEVYDVATYCDVEGADTDVVAAMHAWRVEKIWNVTTEGYQAPTLDAPGFTGTVTCDTCGALLTEGQEIPQGKVYAQLDFSNGAVKNTAFKTAPDASALQKLPNSDEYAYAITVHNGSFRFAIDQDVFAIDESHILDTIDLAVTVEYYLAGVHDAATRIAFGSAGSKNLAFYRSWTGTCWDSACINQNASLVSDKTAIATFTVGKDITYHCPQGQWSGSDKITEPIDLETLTFAKTLVNGGEVMLYGWGNKVSADNPIYIKSITVFNAAELGGNGGEADHYYVNFEGEATNPYYPEYLTQAANGLDAASDCVEWYTQDTEKQYPRFNYTYIKVPSALLTTVDAGATPVKLVIERKEGSTATGMNYQYQIGGPGAVWSTNIDVNFDENGRYEAILLDAAFFNTLNGGSSIRLRDVHYEQAGNEEEGYTYAIREDDDLAGIATVRVYDLREECELYHDQFTEANKNLIWQGRVEPTYEQGGFSGDLVCAHCGEVFQEGEELPILGEFAKLDFSTGRHTAVKSVAALDGNTSLVPVEIPGLAGEYALAIGTHNSGIRFSLSEFGGFNADAIAAGEEIAVSVEYYLPEGFAGDGRIVFDGNNGADKILAIYAGYTGTTWDAAAVNPTTNLTVGAMNVATFKVGKNVTYITGPGQFGAANKFEEAVEVGTEEMALDLVGGGDILLRAWKNKDVPLYVKSITFYNADTLAERETVASKIDYIDYTTEFIESPVYYPQYKLVGYADGLNCGMSDEGLDADGNPIVYAYFGVTRAKIADDEESHPVVIRFTFKDDTELTSFNWSYQGARRSETAPGAEWRHLTTEVTDKVIEVLLDDAVFANGLNGKGSFRLTNDATRGFAVDALEKVEVLALTDKTALEELIAATDAIVKYKTPASIEAYKAELAKAEEVLANSWATEDEVADAVAALEAAADLLVDCDHACGTERVGYVAETCLTKGYTGDMACKDCGYVAPEDIGAEIPAHETEIINVKDATCKEAGNTGDLWCKVCEVIAKPGNTITKLPHTWNEGEVTKEATATEYGEFTKTCTVCGETLVTRLEFMAQSGDVDGNGKVDSTDARLVLQFAVKKIAPTAIDLEVADVDGSGKVDSTDARLILQYAVKKIHKFPAA